MAFQVTQAARKTKLDLRRLIQTAARGGDVDLDELKQILILANCPYDNFAIHVAALEKALEQASEFDAVDYQTKIREARVFLDQAKKLSVELEAEKKKLDEKFARLRELQHKATLVSHWEQAERDARSRMMNSRSQLLGTTSLEEYPQIG